MKRTNGFSAVEIILVILVLVLAGALVWLYFQKSDEPQKTNTSTVSKATEKVTRPECKGDKTGGDDYFCVSGIPVNVPLPDEFVGKFRPILENKSAYQLLGYSAEIGTEKSTLYTLSISTETLRDGDISVSHALNVTTFDTSDNTLYQGSSDKPVPSVEIDGVKFFRATIGDAGVLTTTYVGVVDSKLVKISLSSQTYPGTDNEPSSIDMQTMYDQFDTDVKQLTIIKQ